MGASLPRCKTAPSLKSGERRMSASDVETAERARVIASQHVLRRKQHVLPLTSNGKRRMFIINIIKHKINPRIKTELL
jgi:hypothetical protein